MARSLTLKNTSGYSDEFWRLAFRWCADRMPVKFSTKVELRVVNGSGALTTGRAWSNSVFLRTNRRSRQTFPHARGYYGRPGIVERVLTSRIHDAIYVLAHEMLHTRGQPGDPRKHTVNGRTDDETMERICCKFGNDIAEAIVGEWPAFIAEYRAAARLAKNKDNEREAAIPFRKVAAAEKKLNDLAAKLAWCESESVRLARKAKKLKTRVKRAERTLMMRQAACRS